MERGSEIPELVLLYVYRWTPEGTTGLDAKQLHHKTLSAATSLALIGHHSFLPLGALF